MCQAPSKRQPNSLTLDVIEAPPSTNVVIPPSGATVSGSQTLDAGASSGVTSVQYETHRSKASTMT